MATVYIGSARIDENGNATGGKAGDQTGKEVSTQAWYKHKKGWRVFRAKDTPKRQLIALAMRRACDNSMIGYDQGQRLTLYNAAQKVGFDLGLVSTPCETDCSALVRVCLAYAGIACGNFNTATQAGALLGTGKMVEMTGAKYTDKPDYLLAGDILVTKTQGHTVVVLTDGGKASEDADAASTPGAPENAALGTRTLRYVSGNDHMRGEDVRELQVALKTLGYFGGTPLGNYKALTHKAVLAFQRASGLEADGVYGPLTHTALCVALGAGLDSGLEPDEDAPQPVTDADSAQDGGEIVTALDTGATLYLGPGVQFGIAETVPAGTVMEIRSDTYIPVTYDGKDRYVAADEVSLG